MSDVTFTPSGPSETILSDPDPTLVAALEEARTPEDVASITHRHPAAPLAWGALGDAAREAGTDSITAYAYYRVGYHRGLDQLRKHGWKGSGYVRWEHPSNRGFLACLRGLADMAGAIGEDDEAERCRQFLSQLAPDMPG